MTKVELPAVVRDEAYPADPDFPELEVASDPELMLEVFRAHLRPVGDTFLHIAACTPFRFRCRQSSGRCVLQYTLRVVDRGSGRQWDQWVTGLLYARDGEAEQLWQLMQSGDPAREIPEPWRTFQPVSFIPDLRMLVQVFPYDRKLPNLRLVLGDGALRALEPLLLERLGSGRWQVHDRVIEAMRYRTELGAALKYTLQARDAVAQRRETLSCYLKVYRNSHGEGTFALLQALSGRTAQRPYAVVQPIAYLSEIRTLVLEEAAGTSLQDILLAGNGDAPAAARAIARAVAAFNQDDVCVTRTHSLTDQLGDVRQASRLVQWACPEMATDVQEITDAVMEGLDETPAVPIHRDLKPDHIFVAGDRVVFIDLDSVVLGDPTRDPAHLFAHLLAGVGLDPAPREHARAAAVAFADEYFAHVPPAWRRSFPLHCAGALLEVARGIFKRQEPRWPEKVTAAVAEARNALAGGFG